MVSGTRFIPGVIALLRRSLIGFISRIGVVTINIHKLIQVGIITTIDWDCNIQKSVYKHSFSSSLGELMSRRSPKRISAIKTLLSYDWGNHKGPQGKEREIEKEKPNDSVGLHCVEQAKCSLVPAGANPMSRMSSPLLA